MRSIKRVSLVGGTHGNELSGIYLVRSLLRQPSWHDFPSLDIDCLLANEEAIQLGRRFKDCDLNRCFSKSKLQDLQDERYESRRAQELNQRIGPRFSAEAADLCIDLHNTTSNFGCGIIITNTSSPNLHWKLQLCHFLSRTCPRVRIVFDCIGDCSEEPFLPLVAKNDLTFELGPQAHGTLQAEVFWNQRKLVLQTLDFLERLNSQTLSDEERSEKTLEVYIHTGVVHYPMRSDGSLAALIAAELQGRDFEALRPGDPVFQARLCCQRAASLEPECYPMFINEAAYVSSGIAFQKTMRCELKIPELLGRRRESTDGDRDTGGGLRSPEVVKSNAQFYDLATLQLGLRERHVASSPKELQLLLHKGPPGFVEVDGYWRLLPERLQREAVDGNALLEEVQKTLSDGEAVTLNVLGLVHLERFCAREVPSGSRRTTVVAPSATVVAPSINSASRFAEKKTLSGVDPPSAVELIPYSHSFQLLATRTRVDELEDPNERLKRLFEVQSHWRLPWEGQEKPKVAKALNLAQNRWLRATGHEAIRVLHEEDDRSGRTVEFGDAFHIVENRVQGIGSGDDGAPGVEEHGQVWKATKRSAWPIQQRSWSCLLCINGHGVARDDAQAVVWMRPAAEQLEAMQKLGCRGR
ncbi:unnamed protein product, partial [Durusdinium trenchii]